MPDAFKVRVLIERMDGKKRWELSKCMTYTEAKRLLFTYTNTGHKAEIVPIEDEEEE